MITEKHLREQIARLKNLPHADDQSWGRGEQGKPGYEPGLRDELLRTLWQQADDDAHAKRIIDRVMQEAQFRPTPAELITYAEALRQAEGKAWQQQPTTPSRTPLCTLCDSWGWVVKDGRYVACTCENGQALSPTLLRMANNQLKRDAAKLRTYEEQRDRLAADIRALGSRL